MIVGFFFYFNTKGCYTGGLKTFLSFIVVWPGERGNQGVELSLVPKVNCEKLDIWSIELSCNFTNKLKRNNQAQAIWKTKNKKKIMALEVGDNSTLKLLLVCTDDVTYTLYCWST